MADDFKIAGAYVEVNLRDNTSGDEKRIRAKLEGEKPVAFETALKDPKNTKAIKEKIERGPAAKIPVAAENPIDDAWRRKIQASIKSAATAAIGIPVTPETDQFRRDLEASLKKSSGLLKVQVPVKPDDAAKFRAQVEALVSRAEAGIAAHIPVKVDPKAASEVDTELSRVAARANAEFDALKFGGLSLGLPAAAAIGAAGATAALAVLPIAFAAWAVMASSDNAAVSESFGELSQTVQMSVGEMANSVNGPALAGTKALQAAFIRLQPQINAAFAGSGKAVEPLVGAGTDLIENLMPGVVVAINSANPALLGLRSFAGQTGAGLSDFFANAARGSEGARQGFTIFGGTVDLLLGRLGMLFANLANGSAGPLTQLHVVVDEITGALVDLTGQGSAGISFLNGFGSAAGGTVTVLHSVIGLLNLLPPGVTQVAGTITAASMILSRFGVDAGAAFSGLGANVSKAQGFTNKLQTAVGGLVAGGLSPAGLAVGALALGLGLLGDAQQKAAKNAAEHRQVEQSLTQALRATGGAVDASVRQAAAQAAANKEVGESGKNVLQWAKSLGVALPDVVAVMTGVPGAMDRVTTSLNAHQKATGESNQVTDLFKGTLQGLSKDGDAARKALENEALATTVAGTAARKAQADTSDLGVATMTLRDGAAKAEDRISALKVALDVLSGRTPTFEEAIQAGNDQIRNFAEGLKDGVTKSDGFGKALLNLDGTVNTSTANGSKLQDFAVGLQDSFTNAAAGIDQMVRRGVPLDEAVRRVNDGLTTQRDRFIENARKMGLSATEASNLADKYGLIPKEITTEVTANTKQGEAAIKALPDLAANSPGVVPISANTDAATGKVNATVRYADGSLGVITLDANKDPATGKTMVAVQYANGQRSFMNIDAFNQAAKDRTIEAKRMADGTVAWILVNANTGNAETQINYVARNRTGQITMIVRTDGSVRLPNGNVMNAEGNYFAPSVGFADGGFPTPTKANSFNGLGQMVPPGTYKWAGDAKVPEVFAPLNGSDRTAGLLTKAVEHEKLDLRGGGKTVTFAPTFNIHPPADTDIHALASLVSRELEMRMKTGAY